VGDAGWLSIQAMLGSQRGDLNRELYVGIERLLANRKELAGLLKRFGVRIEISDEVKEFLDRARTDEARLSEVLTSGAAPVVIEDRLRGGRFNRSLRSFQERDLQHLLGLAHGANFSVPGAGKTTVAYATYEAERLAGRIQRLLVIGPLSAFPTWLEEAEECFAPALQTHRYQGGTSIPPSAEVVLVNYQRLDSGYDVLASWIKEVPTMVVLDEAHRMKAGWSGQWGTACLSLAFLAERREVLTGTPAPQSARDLVAILEYLWPSRARAILPSAALVPGAPPETANLVAAAIRPLFVRTTKRELHLPPVIHPVATVPLVGLQREIYTALRNQYQGEFGLRKREQIDFARMGQVVMYLLEAATNPKLLTAGSSEHEDPDLFRHPPLAIDEGSELASLLARYNEHEIPPKFVELGLLVKANAEQGRKTLVWSNFVRNLKLLRRQLGAYEPALIHGGVPAFSSSGEVSREMEIKRFRHDDDCMVLLANPAAMGEGISLHRECHDAIYLERTFNAGQFLQSIDRIHRLGLPAHQETRITFLMTEETIDETVDDRVRKKAAQLGLMLSDPDIVEMALPSDDDYGDPIDNSAEDLEALFNHLRGDDGW
jgi:SNF2 family DNA or RNA helicase